MKDPEVDPIAPALHELLAVERGHAAPSAEGKARVAAMLDAMLLGPSGSGGGGGPGAGLPTPPSVGPVARAARTIAVFVVGAVSGGLLVALLREPRVRVVERVVPAVAESAAAAPKPDVPAETAPLAEPSAGVVPAPSAGAPPRVSDSLAAERALLDPARTALGRGDGASALDAVRKHEARFAKGKLAEEREAIAVQALVIAHRTDEARARAARFQQRYPGSVLAPSVAAALEALP
jgi:hypothetical protein